MCVALYRLAICIAISGKLAKQGAWIVHSIRLNSISHSAYIGVTAGRYADVGMR